MGRPSRYTADQILDAASALVADGSPTALSISGVAGRLGAPSGSIYHRFRSRNVLAASLWLRSVQRFQDGYLQATDQQDPRTAARRAAAHVLAWSRSNLDDATLLLMYRSSDLIDGDWPPELQQRNQLQRDRADRAIAALSRRLGASNRSDRRRVQFAVVDIPYGAVRTPLSQGRPPEPDLDAIVDDAVAAIIDGITKRTRT